jgi:hypothetical protein
VLWSPDLATWQPLGIYTLPVTGELELPSPTTAAAQGFFRVE